MQFRSWKRKKRRKKFVLRKEKKERKTRKEKKEQRKKFRKSWHFVRERLSEGERIRHNNNKEKELFLLRSLGCPALSSPRSFSMCMCEWVSVFVYFVKWSSSIVDWLVEFECVLFENIFHFACEHKVFWHHKIPSHGNSRMDAVVISKAEVKVKNTYTETHHSINTLR